MKRYCIFIRVEGLIPRRSAARLLIFFFLLALVLSCSTHNEQIFQEPIPKNDEINQQEEIDLSANIIENITISLEEENLPVSSFGEVWAYLLSGREATFKNNFPISDLAYFGAEVDTYGKLVNVPDPAKISGYSGRMHLVVTCNGSRPLNHFVLKPESDERRQLIADLLSASERYDGLQIDFEIVPARDGENFLSFLREIRNGLGSKMFTIALPARLRTISDDIYNYTKIEPIVDKIFVMAYDEHWSNSKPGPIASMKWCASVANYAKSVIPENKLIMGIPFYGRTWGNYATNKAYLHSGIERIKDDNSIAEIDRLDGIPYFSFQVPVTITSYYEDNISLSARMEMYKSMNIKAIGFWCLGQESKTFWNYLKLE